jgi:hypothetical protein
MWITQFLTTIRKVTITTETRTLSNGTSAPCYKIVTKSTPTDHNQGLVPYNNTDDATKGGIWIEKGSIVYDVDGAL